MCRSRRETGPEHQASRLAATRPTGRFKNAALLLARVLQVTCIGAGSIACASSLSSTDGERDGGASTSVDSAADASGWPGDGEVLDRPALVEAVRPLYPPSNSFITTNRPVLRWVRAAGVSEVALEICSDRRCDRVEYSARASGDSAAVPMALTRGVHFWRVRASDAMSPNSTVWSFFAPAHDSGRMGTMGGYLDMNHDGFADAISISPISRRLDVMFGSVDADLRRQALPVAYPSVPDVFVAAHPTDVGDVNGDGRSDLLVAPGIAILPVRYEATYLPARLVLGGDPPREAATVMPYAPGIDFGAVATAVSDWNSDGFGDFYAGSTLRGTAMASPELEGVIMAGQAGGALPEQIAVLPRSGNVSDYGPFLVGDLNGDQREDLCTFRDGQWVVLWGGSSGGTLSHATALASDGWNPASYSVRHTISRELRDFACDLNADGVGDLVLASAVSDLQSIRFRVYWGRESPPASWRADLEFTTPVLSPGRIVREWACVRDQSGDGYDDLVVMQFDLPFRVWRASAPMSDVPRWSDIEIPSESFVFEYSRLFSRVGWGPDFNRDGYTDGFFAVGTRRYVVLSSPGRYQVAGVGDEFEQTGWTIF